jgi:photosystem II stability/assembly factor-like uncharacterized protein
VSRCFRGSVVLVALISSVMVVAAAQQYDPTLYNGMRWRMIGPFRGGRTVPITGVPGKPNVFYIGVNNGGVWRSTDYGHTWQSLFDDQPTQSVGTLAIAPSNPDVIYVGSGEGLRRPDLSIGDGIYKSKDGGKTWKNVGLRDGQQIGSILVDPRNPNRVYCAVVGHPYGANAERGVFRSVNGGETWEKVLYKDEDTGAIDLAFDPANAQTIYAVLWASRLGPWESGSWQGPNSGLYRSTDGGTNWRPLTKGLPSTADGLGRIGLGIAPSDSRRMYAIVEAPARLGGLYRSDDAGESWRRVNNENRVWGRASDFAEVKVHPKNPDVVFVANTSTYRSTDGGQNFTAIKGAPGGDDYHRVWINPENPDIIALASDQGATISVNAGETWSSWYNQPTAQFYHVITDNRFPYWVYGGQQESGSVGIASRSEYGSISFRDWHTVGAEEYGYVAPDPLDPNIIYGGKISRYDERTHQTQDISPAVARGGGSQYRFLRTAPVMFSPVDRRVLYLAGNVLFKTTNGGHSWSVISPDLSRPNPGVPASLGVFAQAETARVERRGVIYSLGPSFKDVNVIWAGTDDGLIHVTRDGGKTWSDVTPPEMTAWSKVTQIEASHYDAMRAYAAVNRFRIDDLRPYVYRTHDGGKTWQKVTAGLPENEPVNTVREDPVRKGLLFAGTERSVYVSFDDGEHWQSLRMNLPASSVRDLVVHGDDIVVGTHGRSFWILDDITPLRQLNAEAVSAEAFLFKPQEAYRVRRSTNTDTPLPPEEPVGQNPPDGAIVNYYLKAAAPVTLEILDSAGKTVRRYSSTDRPEPVNEKELAVPTNWVRPSRVLRGEAGMHRWTWDLHYSPLLGAQNGYPISAIPHDTPPSPQGPRALPGQYSIRLLVGGKTYTQPLLVKMDPRVTVDGAALRQQFDAEARIAGAMSRDHEALAVVRNVRKQIAKLLESHSSVDAALKSLDDKLAAVEGTGGGRFGGGAPARAGEPEGLARIAGTLTRIYDMVDSADAAPTTQALAALNESTQALEKQLGNWTAIQSSLPAMNQQLSSAGLPIISVAAESR